MSADFTAGFRLFPGTPLAEAHDDGQAALLQVEGMGMALASVPDDRDLPILDLLKIRILVIIDLHGTLLGQYETNNDV
jgi:hypothetical protein